MWINRTIETLLAGPESILQRFPATLLLGPRQVGKSSVLKRLDPDRRYATREQQLAYYDEVLRRARAIPGVEQAWITDALPLGRLDRSGRRRGFLLTEAALRHDPSIAGIAPQAEKQC